MSSWSKLLNKAQNQPTNLRFDELCECELAQLAGFEPKRQRGSHDWFKHPSISDFRDAGISLQRGRDGKAKVYQVTQLLNKIEYYGLGPT